MLARVKEIIGPAQQRAVEGIELEEFLDRYLAESSRALFLDMDNSCPECKSCRSKRYVVSFSQKPQVPPEIVGVVICAGCGTAMNPEVE